jgi:hypothetical protein
MLPSFEEKSVWVQLVSLVVVLGGYFVLSGVMMANGVTLLVPFVPVFITATVLLIIVMALGHVLAAFTGKVEKRDERDRLIGWRAESNSSWVLGSGVFFAMCALIIGIEPVWVVHLLLASMFLSEVLKLALQLLYYKRGV